MRRLIFAALLLLSLIFIIFNVGEMQAILTTLQRGDWRYLLLALGVQAIWMLNYAVTIRSVYRPLGLVEGIERLYLMVASAQFVNIVAPSAGVGGLAVYISEARRRGQSTAHVTIAGGLVVFLDYLSFLTVLALGLIVLFRRDNLNATELTATGVLAIAASIMAVLIYLGMHSEKAMGKMLAWIVRPVNRFTLLFLRREFLLEKSAYVFANEASLGLRKIRHNPKSMIFPALLSLANKALLIFILLLCFLAFDVPFSPGTIIAGFSIGYLFLIVSPTPAGIGFVEGAMTLGLRSLNVPLSDATVIALAYRGITFWLPLLVGIIAFRWLTRGEKAEVSA